MGTTSNARGAAPRGSPPTAPPAPAPSTALPHLPHLPHLPWPRFLPRPSVPCLDSLASLTSPAPLTLFSRSPLASLPSLPSFRSLPSPSSLSSLASLVVLGSCSSFLPRPPSYLSRLSLDLVKATALELAILTGHLFLYPSGVRQERVAVPVEPRPDTDGQPPRLPTTPQPPVLLLHGFIDNRSVFVLLRRSLAEHGRRQVESVNHSPVTCDIRTAAEQLAERVEARCARTGQGEVDLVGHSLGGLIARYYVQRLGGDVRVRTLVTLGTPHAGTRVAPLMSALPIVRQMRPHSDLIEELRAPAPGCRTRFVSFWSDLDEIMDPLETAALDHPDLIVENVPVKGIGHLALPVHPTVTAAVREALDGDALRELRADGLDGTGGTNIA